MAGKRCTVCGKECEELEPAFRRPDAVFAVPREEWDARIAQSDDFVSIDDAAFFIRCVAPIPVRGRDEPYCWGFWVKVAKEHFLEYRGYFSNDPPVDHPGFRGTLANQTSFLPPTLGLPAHVHLGRGKGRPRLMLLDSAHPLTKKQEGEGTEVEVHAWSEASGQRDPLKPVVEPPIPRFTATLEDHGWLVAKPGEVGKQPEPFGTEPALGDCVKAPFVFLAADEHGDVMRRLELMWVELDEVRRDGWLCGALNNDPFVPGPLTAGTRVWLRAEQVIGHWPSNRRTDQDAPAVGESSSPAPLGLFGRLSGWLRGSRRRT